MKLNNCVVFDIETLKLSDEVEGGWKNPYGMGFGCAVAYDFRTDDYIFFGKGRGEAASLIRLMTGRIGVGFNSIKFDNKVLLGSEYTDCPWTNLDLLHEIGKAKFGTTTFEQAITTMGRNAVYNGSINLDAIMRGTFGEVFGKSGSGALAPEMIKEGAWAQLFAYNLRDVRLTRKLFEHIVNGGYVIDGRGNKMSPKIEL